MPTLRGFVIHGGVKSVQEGSRGRGEGIGRVPPNAHTAVVGAHGGIPVKCGGGKRPRMICSIIVPSEVKSAGVFGHRATSGDSARGGLELKAFGGSPGLKGSNTRGVRNAEGGPGRGVEFKVTDKNSGNVRRESKAQEGH